MSATSALRIDNIETVAGAAVLGFGTGGSMSFNGSYAPANFGIPRWDGNGNRPTGVPLGSFGWNSKNTRLEIYIGIDSQTGDPLWVVFDGNLLTTSDLED